MLSIKDFAPEQLIQQNDKKDLHHIFDEDDCYAMWSAYAAGRPLLVRGKPGTGKSQMAKAIADRLGWALVSEVVRGSTELSDLHWSFDAIGRLGEAQTQGVKPRGESEASLGQGEPNKDPLDPENFLSPGAFWWAYDWETAETQHTNCKSNLRPRPEETEQKEGVVLLIDEIDKAEPDLPNGLLETLGNYEFTAPYVDQAKGINPVKGDKKRLLIIITTNEERELPAAFVRRCFVHTLKMDESVDWLVKRGELHFGKEIDSPVYKMAAEQLIEDRRSSLQGRYPPGLAEYIDLLQALKEVPLAEQQTFLKKIASFALNKEVAS